MKNFSIIKNFGERLAGIRHERGLTQRQLAKMTSISERMIAYYETNAQYPPVNSLIPLAKALHVSLDELAGIKDTQSPVDAAHATLWRKLKKAAILPKQDQKTLLQNLNDLLEKNRIKK